MTDYLLKYQERCYEAYGHARYYYEHGNQTLAVMWQNIGYDCYKIVEALQQEQLK